MTTILKIYAGIQLIPAILARHWIALLIIFALTLLFGRVYCRFICPLGILQSVVRLFRGPRRVCTRLRMGYGGKARVVMNVVILAAVILIGALGLGWQWLDPYAIATRFVTMFFAPEFDWCVVIFAAVPCVVILLLAAFAGGRIWCNWVCPVGTVMNFLSRFAWKKDKVKKSCGCSTCRKCFAVAAQAKGEKKEDMK